MRGVRPGRIFLGQLASPMLLVLAGAGFLSAVLGNVKEALVIFVVVTLNAWIGFRQEYRAERAMASLRAMATPTVKVLRDGAPLNRMTIVALDIAGNQRVLGAERHSIDELHEQPTPPRGA